jgi:GNAT superfamily N-acetyltransferase
MLPAVTVSIRELGPGHAEACDAIVAGLPYHFETGRNLCAHAVRESPGLVAVAGGRVVSFLAWRAWYGTAVEITWMAVDAGERRHGVGGRLIEALVARASGIRGIRYLLVTTLSEATPEPGVEDGYARTRRFYQRNGFVPIWDPRGWWSDANQAVVMLRVLEA